MPEPIHIRSTLASGSITPEQLAATDKVAERMRSNDRYLTPEQRCRLEDARRFTAREVALFDHAAHMDDEVAALRAELEVERERRYMAVQQGEADSKELEAERDALRAELEARPTLTDLQAVVTVANAKVERMRPVVESARQWRAGGWRTAEEAYTVAKALTDAVDAYRQSVNDAEPDESDLPTEANHA